MALNLSTNLNFELMRLALAAQGLSSAEIDDLMPHDGPIVPPPLPEIAGLYPLQRHAAAATPGRPHHHRRADRQRRLQQLGRRRARARAPASRCSPTIRTCGSPRPPIWYLAHLALEQPGASVVNVVGATLPGLPLVVLGRSDTLAWGFTNTGPDVQDLFIEKINPDNPREYLTPEGWRPVRGRADGDRREGRRRAQRRAPPHAPRAGAAGLLSQSGGAAGAGTRGGPAVDGAQRRRHHDCHRHGRCQRAHRRRLHGAHAPLRRADAEHGGRRHERQDRPDRAGARAGARSRQQDRRPRARARLGRNLRLEGLPRVRGPAARRRPARRAPSARPTPASSGRTTPITSPTTGNPSIASSASRS